MGYNIGVNSFLNNMFEKCIGEVIKVYTAVKIRLIPTKEQEVLFWKSAGTARWAYNYFLEVNEKAYKTWLENGKVGKRTVSDGPSHLFLSACGK